MSRAPNRRLKKATADKSINVLVLFEWTLRIFSCFSMVLCGCRIGLVRWWMVVWYVGVVVKREKERETINIDPRACCSPIRDCVLYFSHYHDVIISHGTISFSGFLSRQPHNDISYLGRGSCLCSLKKDSLLFNLLAFFIASPITTTTTMKFSLTTCALALFLSGSNAFSTPSAVPHRLFTALSAENIASNILDLVGNTPLIRLNRVVDQTGAEVVCKLESQNPANSVKDRIAMSMILEAEKRGDIQPGETILVEPTVRLSLLCCVCVNCGISSYIHTYIHTYIHAYIHTWI